MLIIGSHAAIIGLARLGWGTGVGHPPNDIDILCTREQMEDLVGLPNPNRHSPSLLTRVLGSTGPRPESLTKYGENHCYVESILNDGYIFDFELVDNQVSGQAYLTYARFQDDKFFMNVQNARIQVAPLEVVYSMKRSHRHFKKQWKKHIQDYHLLKSFMKQGDVLKDVTAIREKETAELLQAHKAYSLNKTVRDFFDDNVSNRWFIHDEMHQIMAYYDEPLFERLRVSKDIVKCSKEKFLQLSYVDRMRCVLEEAYVIALERAIIPMIYEGKYAVRAEQALDWSIMRVCTTLTSGWFRDFATESYPDIMNEADLDYPVKFFTAVDQGRIKLVPRPELAEERTL